MHPYRDLQTDADASGVFKPARLALGEAAAAVRGYDDPLAAWRLLTSCGLLPAGWLDDPRRRFPWLPGIPLHERHDRLRRVPFVPTAPSPDLTDVCALMAADVPGIVRAETLGLALTSALTPWGVPAASVILWAPTSASQYSYQLHDTKPDVWEPDALLWGVFRDVRVDDLEAAQETLMGGARKGHDDPRWQAASAMAVWAVGHRRWTMAVRAGERVPRSAPRGAAGQLYSRLVDPFELGVALLQTGYAPLPSTDGLLVLGYPSS